VLDDYHTHKHDDINQWLAKHPRITLHFTSTSGSWLNLVEVLFGISPARPSGAAPSTASSGGAQQSGSARRCAAVGDFAEGDVTTAVSRACWWTGAGRWTLRRRRHLVVGME
jgi:hypothetical protein